MCVCVCINPRAELLKYKTRLRSIISIYVGALFIESLSRALLKSCPVRLSDSTSSFIYSKRQNS